MINPKIESEEIFYSNNKILAPVSLNSQLVSSLEQRAQNIAKKYLNNLSKENQQEITEKLILPGLVYSDKIEASVDSKEREYFLSHLLPLKIKKIIQLIEDINFALGYEFEQKNYPSTETFQPLVEEIIGLKEKFNQFKGSKSFIKEFDQQFSPFLTAIEEKIRFQAIESRQKQLAHLEQNPTEENLYQAYVVEAHISSLQSKPSQHWLELRDILNLQGDSNKPRTYTRKEMDFFHFITTIYDRLNA